MATVPQRWRFCLPGVMPDGDGVMPDETTTAEAEETTEQREAGGEQSVEKLLSALHKERERNKSLKQLEREAAELRKFKQERETAEQTEAEKLQSRTQEIERKAAELEQREKRMAVRDALSQAATDQKLTLVASTHTVLRLLDLDSVEFAEDGTPKNLGTLLKELAKDEPALFDQRKRQGSADAGARNDGGMAAVGSGMARIRYGYEQTSKRG